MGDRRHVVESADRLPHSIWFGHVERREVSDRFFFRELTRQQAEQLAPLELGVFRLVIEELCVDAVHAILTFGQRGLQVFGAREAEPSARAWSARPGS